jgi:ATP-dependent exoDNAse (exonuclease V) beta subunit
MDKGELKRFVLDRTFVCDGVRWIIDYKASTPAEGESIDTFQARLADEYLTQLEQYASLLNEMGTEPVHVALYAMATQSFIEVDLSDAKKAA